MNPDPFQELKKKSIPVRKKKVIPNYSFNYNYCDSCPKRNNHCQQLKVTNIDNGVHAQSQLHMNY